VLAVRGGDAGAAGSSAAGSSAGSSAAGPGPGTAPTAPGPVAVTEIEMPVDDVGSGSGTARPADPPPSRVVRAGSGAGSTAGSARRPPDRAGSGKDPGSAKEPSAPDEAALRTKFQAAAREYRAYKERMGPRLESEWTDLASMVAFLSTPESRASFDKKIDRFRARMRE